MNRLAFVAASSISEPVTTHVRIWQRGNAIERWLVSQLEIHGEQIGAQSGK